MHTQPLSIACSPPLHAADQGQTPTSLQHPGQTVVSTQLLPVAEYLGPACAPCCSLVLTYCLASPEHAGGVMVRSPPGCCTYVPVLVGWSVAAADQSLARPEQTRADLSTGAYAHG